MIRFLFFIFIISISSNAFSQFDSNIKFKPIPASNTKPKVKKEIPPISNFPKLNIPKIVAPNVLKETNIFGTKPKPKPYSTFEIGTTENYFSMTLKNKFEHKVGDVYQTKMEKDLDKTMIREGLKEDDSFLDRNDRYLGEFKTKSDHLILKYRDYIQIDGDLINIYLNDKLIRSQLYLYSQMDKIKIPLTVGINKLELVVASTGTSGGNTAEIHVIDDISKSVTDEYWNNLALGTKIKLIIIKE